MNKIFLALRSEDYNNQGKINDLIPYLAGIKVGMSYFFDTGLTHLSDVCCLDIPVMLDLKLADTPDTIISAIDVILYNSDPKYITINAMGGKEMLQAANEACYGYNTIPVAVVTLTSLDEPTSLVYDRVRWALEAGYTHFVMPVHMSVLLDDKKSTIFSPGIRLEITPTNDHHLTFTPKYAQKLGVKYFVIGRPIMDSDNPLETLKNINEVCGE